MARLYSDLYGAGRYYYDLDSAPGIVSPGVGSVSFGGLVPIAVERSEVFRTPATATLTINLLAPASDTILMPNVAALAYVGQIAAEQRILILTPTNPPDYSNAQETAPTILYINTITPTTGLVSLSELTLNVTQGGNILTVTPGVASLSNGTGVPTLIFSVIGVGSSVMNGLTPGLVTTLAIDLADGAAITVYGLAPTIDVGFVWRDVEQPPALTWA
jgi:hypothetical protein